MERSSAVCEILLNTNKNIQLLLREKKCIYCSLIDDNYKGAPKNIICDVIKKPLKRRAATRSGKENQPLDIKTAFERPILTLGFTNHRWSFYFILFFVASLLLRRIFKTSHMTLSIASF